MFAKRNEFTFDVRRKERKGKASTSSNFTQKKQRESKGDFTRMTRKDNIHFPFVKMRRKRVTKKGRKAIKRNGESNQHL